MNRIPIYNYTPVYNKAQKKATVHIDGQIVDAQTKEILQSFYGDTTSTSCRSLRNEVDDYIADGCNEIDVIINSPGGHVGDAMAIHDYLVECQKNGIKVNCEGRGIVASSGTLILDASANSTMTENSIYLIHNVSGGIYGDVNIVENYAKQMRTFNDIIQDHYIAKVESNGKTLDRDELCRMMDCETVMNAEQARQLGFISGKSPAQPLTNSIDPTEWGFKNTDILNTYNSQVKTSLEMANIHEQVKAIGMSLAETVISELKSEKISEKASEAIANAVSTQFITAFDKLAVENEAKITELVNKAMEGKTVDVEAIQNTLQNTLKTEVETMTQNIVALLGKPANNKKAKDEEEAEDDDMDEEMKKKKEAKRNKIDEKTGMRNGAKADFANGLKKGYIQIQ